MKNLPHALSRGAIAASLIAACGLSAGAQTLSLQLKASNYNPSTGIWADSSGNLNDATYGGSSMPTLVGGVTPNGSSAVNFGHNGVFSLAVPIAPGSYTALAYLMPVDGGDYAIFGGTGYSSVEWRTYQGHQQILNEWTALIGAGTGNVSSSSFSLIGMTVSPTGGTLALNGAADGSTAGFAPSAPITFVGNNYGTGGGEAFNGYISEIDIYSGVLTPDQISAAEGQLTARYIATVPEPTSLALVAGGLGLLFANRRLRRA